MFRPFQVNEGRYLPVEPDLPPTARVSELCSAVKAVSNEAEEDQVMLTNEGKQMEPGNMIGAYSVGTEDKPIFVFYRSYLTTSQPPSLPSRLPNRGDFELKLELLRQKPTPSLFQKLVILAKRLSEYVVSVGRLCGHLCDEYQLQYSGWCTALSNCDAIIRTYHKHHKLFSKEVESFRSTEPEYLQLLQEFPEKIELLQQLPMPSSLQDQNPASSLYDWINTHDERNSLLDLSKECKKALSNLDSSSIPTALLATHQITEETDKLHSQDEQFGERVKELVALAKKAAELTDTAVALAQNIQSTSERAHRYGDAGTIADLVVSHHKSLQMMSENCTQLESLAKEAEASKASLTRFIHTKLQQVAKLQERVAHSNSQLLLLHEHIKLARKRFEVLRQVCHTPQVLAHVLTEVDRRIAFNSTLEKRAEEVSLCLRQAREEEKQLRRSFVSNYGHHFISTLFPELMQRVPDISVHLPRSLSRSSQSYHSDLERIRQLLPPDMRPSPASASVQLLSSPLLTSLSVGSHPLRTHFNVTNIEDGAEFSSEMKQLMESSAQTGSSLDQSEEKSRLEVLLQKLEAANSQLKESVSSCTSERETLKRQLLENELTNKRMSTSLEEDRARLQQQVSQLEITNRQLSSKVDEKDRYISQLKSTNEELSVRVEYAEGELKQVEFSSQVMANDLQLLKEEVNQVRLQSDNLSAENKRLASEMKQTTQDSEEAESRYSDLYSKHESELKQHRDTVSHLELSNRDLSSQNESMKTEIVQLQESLSQLESANQECVSQKEALQAEVSEMKSNWERERNALNDQITKCSAELTQCQVKNESLASEVIELTSANSALCRKEDESEKLSCEIQEAKQHREQLEIERNSLLIENQNLKDQCKKFQEEQMRQASRHQQAQNALSSLRAQINLAESKLDAARIEIDNLRNKLEAGKVEVDSIKVTLQSAEDKVKELNAQLSFKERHHLESVEAERAEKEAALKENNLLQEKLRALLEEKSQLQDTQVQLEEKLIEETEKLKDMQMRLDETNSQTQLEELERERDSLKQELSEKEKELESVTSERDSLHKQAMEQERELKELQRLIELETVQRTLDLESPVRSQQQQLPEARSVASLKRFNVSVAGLKDGDVALFISDTFGNYIALVTDLKIYYLNQGSVPKLNELGIVVPQFNLSRKILIGRITGRMHVEVRKEGNRLRVPVGTRMYKLDAEPVSL